MQNTLYRTGPPRRSLAATLAIFAAIGGVFATMAGHQGWGLFAGIAAIVLGALGFLISLSPNVHGGAMSGLAVVLGVLGVGVAVLGLVLGALF